MADEESVVWRVLSNEDHLSLLFFAMPTACEVCNAAAVSRAWREQSRDEHIWQALYQAKYAAIVSTPSFPALQDIRVGALVQLTGILSRPDLNGLYAKVWEWDQDAGRWLVQPDAVLIRPRPREYLLEGYDEFDLEIPAAQLAGQPIRPQFGPLVPRTCGTSEPHPTHSRIKLRMANMSGLWRLRFCRRHLGQGLPKGSLATTPGVKQHTTGHLCGFYESTIGTHPGDNRAILRTRTPLFAFEDDLGYFEVRVSGSSVGLTHGDHYDSRRSADGNHIGWRPISYGFHSDDGSKWRFDSVAAPPTTNGERFGAPFGAWRSTVTNPNPLEAEMVPADIIGCGLDFRRRSVFFTKNGVLVGVAFDRLPQTQNALFLQPTVTLHQKRDVCGEFNLGEHAFEFDVAAFAASAERWAPVVGGAYGRDGDGDD